MLKSTRDPLVHFVSQPDHAMISGYLAAHWGNDRFSQPGYFAATNDAEALRAETVFGIAQHDNGWWEWEAAPEVGEDGLPLGLSDVLRNRQAGMDRWRRGIPRFAAQHPYASLLISWHAYWLYAPALDPQHETAFRHPLFWDAHSYRKSQDEIDDIAPFVEELRGLQTSLAADVRSDPNTSDWMADQHLWPHVRLLQALDGISLAICSDLVPTETDNVSGTLRREFTLADLPRQNWDDRVTINVAFLDDHRLLFDPFPFQLDPLPVYVPTRTLFSSDNHETFTARWHGRSMSLECFEFVSRS